MMISLTLETDMSSSVYGTILSIFLPKNKSVNSVKD